MTIREAITQVLTGHDEGLTCQEIYNAIITDNLYKFNALNPQAIVKTIIRRQCYGLDFPTASISKYFKIVGGSGKKLRYGIYNRNEEYDTQIEAPTKPPLSEEQSPEEKLAVAHKEHLAIIKMQLKSTIHNSDPKLFESLVIELLSKMGYGYDHSAAKVTNYVKDGGIDGIIDEDRLGLDKIYVQAKRYKDTVPRPDVDKFMGVLAISSVRKGIFITTSNFTKETIQKYGNTIRLIDGDELMDLLIAYELAVNVVKSYKTYTLDENYFNS